MWWVVIGHHLYIVTYHVVQYSRLVHYFLCVIGRCCWVSYLLIGLIMNVFKVVVRYLVVRVYSSVLDAYRSECNL